MRAVLASQNRHKLVELSDILSRQGIDVCLQSDVGVSVEVEETGTTFEENALLKATAVMQATGMTAIADDSGLVVDALGGGPGIYSARYGGEGLDDAGRCQLLLRSISGQTNRKCRFVSVIACVFPDGSSVTAEGTCEGVVAFAPMGENGFGYDPIFLIPGRGKTMAQIPPEEKNQISHRANALKSFSQKLDEYLKEHPQEK